MKWVSLVLCVLVMGCNVPTPIQDKLVEKISEEDVCFRDIDSKGSINITKVGDTTLVKWDVEEGEMKMRFCEHKGLPEVDVKL